MDTGRYERGWEQLSAITGEKGRSTIDELSRFSPDLCRFIVEFACIPYIGFPRVMNAIAVVRRVFAEKGIAYEPPTPSA